MMLMLLAIMFISSVQPIMMVVSLIFITLLYSYYVMMMMGSFWFSYVLIMIMLTGVFVIFIYMASLIPNEEFEIYMFIYFIVFMFMFFIKDQSFLSVEIFEIVSLSLWKIYMGGWMLFLGIMLFVVMLMVIWISCKNVGALRVI